MIIKLFIPVFAVLLLTGCVSSEEKKAQELNNTRLLHSLKYPGTTRLKYTLERGGDPNVKDSYGVPALTNAVAMKRFEHIEMLLAHGADINALDKDGETALFPAVGSGDIDLVKLLVKKGANLNICGKNGKTLAMEAARLGHIDMLKYLLENGADINAVDENKAGLAAYAATAKNAIKMLQFLEEKGIKAELNNTELMASPFLRALFFDQEKTAIYLLSKMQDFNKDEQMRQIGKLAIYYAISHNRTELLKALIRKKVELNYNEPFIYKFANKINVDGIYKLAARNDIIDKRYTPLMYACIFGRPHMIKLLIAAGANPLIENNEGRIAQDYAKDSVTAKVIKDATDHWYKTYMNKKKVQKGITIKQDPNIKRATILE